MGVLMCVPSCVLLCAQVVISMRTVMCVYASYCDVCNGVLYRDVCNVGYVAVCNVALTVECTDVCIA